jgi:prepilin-type N-terminal cleavage/methylation domain-containing protein
MANTRGFTLIEVVVALTILLVVMVGLVTMTGKTANIAAVSDRQSVCDDGDDVPNIARVPAGDADHPYDRELPRL